MTIAKLESSLAHLPKSIALSYPSTSRHSSSLRWRDQPRLSNSYDQLATAYSVVRYQVVNFIAVRRLAVYILTHTGYSKKM